MKRANMNNFGCLKWGAIIFGGLLLIAILLILMPFITIIGAICIWYFSKKKSDPKMKNIAIGITAVGAVCSIFITPQITNKKEEHKPATLVTNTSKNTTSSASPNKEMDEKPKIKDSKKLEKQKEAEKKKAEKEKREAEQKRAEEEKKLSEVENAVQNLEHNQITENILPAQTAVDSIENVNKKSELQHRIDLVKEAISVREAEKLAQQQAQRTVYVAQFGKSDAYWYSMDNMPSTTNRNKVITMTEAEAIAQGKHHSSKE